MLSHIRRVDIEFHSKCNRLCKWCPNIEYKRNGEDIIMSDELYTRIVEELRDNNFGNGINITVNSFTNPLDRAKNEAIFSFLGYQEPFTNPELFKRRVNEAYDKLPSTVQITASTNGDFLEKEYLDDLHLTTLLIADYDDKGMDYWKEKLKSLDILVVSDDEEQDILIGVHRYIGNVRVLCNWTKHYLLENRGGYFQPGDLSDMLWRNDMKKRDLPCYELVYNLTINYTGDVMPCCHMRQDNPNHKEFILGNVNDNTIVEISKSNKLNEFKNNILNPNNEFPSTCEYCQKQRIENFIIESID
jgi:radical SAM protein with 4Fe4S-binding SPASM domain